LTNVEFEYSLNRTINFQLLDLNQPKQTDFNFSFISSFLYPFISLLNQNDIFGELFFDILSCFPLFSDEDHFLNFTNMDFQNFFNTETPFSFMHHVRIFSSFLQTNKITLSDFFFAIDSI
jgi:hypothetical protein